MTKVMRISHGSPTRVAGVRTYVVLASGTRVDANSGAITDVTLWAVGMMTRSMALLPTQPIHTVQSLAQQVDMTKYTAELCSGWSAVKTRTVQSAGVHTFTEMWVMASSQLDSGAAADNLCRI